MNYFAVQQKWTEHCTSALLQSKKISKRIRKKKTLLSILLALYLEIGLQGHVVVLFFDILRNHQTVGLAKMFPQYWSFRRWPVNTLIKQDWSFYHYKKTLIFFLWICYFRLPCAAGVHLIGYDSVTTAAIVMWFILQMGETKGNFSAYTIICLIFYRSDVLNLCIYSISASIFPGDILYT